MISRNNLIGLTQDLIRIDSQNPPGNERKIALFVQSYLQGLGLKVERYEFRQSRTNIIARLSGNGRYSLLFTPHLDTVPSGGSWKVGPFSARVKKGRIYGLGATDCKCNLASLMEAIRSAVDTKAKLPYNLIFAATADEESGSTYGLIPLLNKGILLPDAAVVLDADDAQIVTTQKGLVHLKVKIEGKKAHGAYPGLGINAIEIAVQVINTVKETRLPYKKNKYLKPPTVNIGTIKGGDKVNVVADWCEFELDFRYLPGTDSKEIISILNSILTKYAKNFKVEIESVQKPYIIPESDPLVRYLRKAFMASGIKPKISGSEGATVITFFQERGIPAVATGFGVSSCAHTANEYVDIDRLYKGTVALENFIKTYQP